MAETLQTFEPERIRRGDTVKWKKLAVVYGEQRKPGDGWTLTYTTARENFSTSFSSTTDDGGLFSVTVAATHAWQAKVTDGSETFTIDEGTWEIEGDLAELDGRGIDTRSVAQEILDALEATLARKATKDQLSYSIGDRSIGRMTWPELMEARNHFRAEVAAERRAQRRERGLSHEGIIKVVF